MQRTTHRTRSRSVCLRSFVAVCCAVALVPGDHLLFAQEKPPTAPTTPPPAAPAAPAKPPASTTPGAPASGKPAAPAPAGKAADPEAKIPPEQLDSLVAPIALYPDPLLAQTLVASTYPLEIVQLHQWLAKNAKLKDKALEDAVAKQPWDPSIQSMAGLPDVVKRLADDIEWTTELGNAFLAQQSEVMDAVQRMRTKAKANGALESNEQQKVETKVVEEKTIIIVEPTSPEVIYVPTYSPTVVYGPAYYPYPPIYYPPYPPGAAFVSFTFGVAVGAAFWGNCGWGHSSNVNINVNNNYNRVNHNNVNTGNRNNNNWQHNSQHRGAAPYSNKATASKYGGSTRGSQSAGGGTRPSTQPTGAGGNRGASAGTSDRSAGGSSSRGSGASPSATSSSRSSGASGGGSQASSRSSSGGGGGGGGGGSGLSGGSGGYSGSSARASSSRGSSSMGGGGGGSRGGGGGGGGGRRR